MDTGIHKIHLFHASDLHFHFSANTKARWWILKSTKQVKCWIRCIYHCKKNQPQHRERGYFLKPLYTFYTLTIQSESKERWRLSTVSTLMLSLCPFITQSLVDYLTLFWWCLTSIALVEISSKKLINYWTIKASWN